MIVDMILIWSRAGSAGRLDIFWVRPHIDMTPYDGISVAGSTSTQDFSPMARKLEWNTCFMVLLIADSGFL